MQDLKDTALLRLHKNVYTSFRSAKRGIWTHVRILQFISRFCGETVPCARLAVLRYVCQIHLLLPATIADWDFSM